MSITFMITRVDEPEFGCEGPLDGEPINGTIWMTSENGQEIIEKMNFNELCKRKLFENTTVIRSEEYGLLRKVNVSAAIFIKDGKLFAAQRGYGPQKGMWEFPGGKIESGETPEQTVIRELREELDCTIIPDRLFDIVEFDYPTFHLTMYCYICHLLDGTPKMLEHEKFAWLSKDELFTVNWLPADMDILKKIENIL